LNVIEAPHIWSGTIRKSADQGMFLAGGITNCPDWQSETIAHLEKDLPSWSRLTVLNPRRANFPINDPGSSEDQIIWERLHLSKADLIFFWFPKETLCPIVLFELGAALHSNTPLIIGTDIRYARRADVEIQTRLVRPKEFIHADLTSMRQEVTSMKRDFNLAGGA
jgi:hypothetical protein